jgi:hypothetical protein
MDAVKARDRARNYGDIRVCWRSTTIITKFTLLRFFNATGIEKRGELYYHSNSDLESGGGMKRKMVRVNDKTLRLSMAVLCLLALALTVACGGKKAVKPVSPESKLSQEAFAVAEALRVAYVKKEFSAIKEISTVAGFQTIMDSIKNFDSVELTFTPKWVEIDKSLVELNVAWKGTWTVGGEMFAERGMAVFLLEGKPLKLSNVLRGNPFKYPERQ